MTQQGTYIYTAITMTKHCNQSQSLNLKGQTPSSKPSRNFHYFTIARNDLKDVVGDTL